MTKDELLRMLGSFGDEIEVLVDDATGERPIIGYAYRFGDDRTGNARIVLEVKR
jgi:hypothetical protein